MSDSDVYDENLRRQVNDAYRPIDLFDSQKDCFFCPKCKQQLILCRAEFIENKFNKSLVQTSCAECGEWLCFKLPALKKKRVYLDQSVISDLCVLDAAGLNEIASTDWRERLLAKIILAKRLQKACFIVSEIHVQETVPIPHDDTKKACWKLANSLADGRISGNFIDAFEYELHLVLGFQSEKKLNSSINCYMDFEIDAWSIHSPILMTNTWRLRLNHNQIDFRNASTENFTKILETQRIQVGLNPTVEECIQHLKKVYLSDLVDGIKYAQSLAAIMRTFSQFDNATSINRDLLPLDIANFPKNNGYGSIIFRATEDSRDASKQLATLSNLLEQVELQGIDAFPCIKIQTVLEGEVLHRWAHGLQANPNKFNENYGSSKFMDISHLAVFLPVVDVLTVDKATFSRCQQSEIKLEIDNYSCKLLRMSETQPELEVWLDDLLAEPETDEFRCTRRLFFGRDLAEEKRDEENFMNEIANVLQQKS